MTAKHLIISLGEKTFLGNQCLLPTACYFPVESAWPQNCSLLLAPFSYFPRVILTR